MAPLVAHECLQLVEVRLYAAATAAGCCYALLVVALGTYSVGSQHTIVEPRT